MEAEDQSEQQTQASGNKITVILDLAALETVKTKRGDFELLNCDDHKGVMKKHNRDPKEYRPDILHQELMALLDSPLNKSGNMQVFVHTNKNVLFTVSPKCRIPRTFKRFAGLMVQLLHRLKIRSASGSETLMKVVKNPISRHLPAGCKCYGFTHTGTLYNPTHLAASMPEDKPIVLVFGAMASGHLLREDHPYVEEWISISEYPLSGTVAINRMLGAIEAHRGIV